MGSVGLNMAIEAVPSRQDFGKQKVQLRRDGTRQNTNDGPYMIIITGMSA